MRLTKITSLFLYVALGAAGTILAARAWFGPFEVAFAVHSPLNAEGWFAVAALVLVATAPRGSGSPNPALTGRGWWWLAALLVLIALAFARAASSDFLSDDFLIVRYANEYHFNFRQAFATPGGDGFFRPVGNFLLALTALWAHVDPLRWHLTGFVLHAVNTLLVFALGRYLNLDRLSAWFAAGVFAVHGSLPEAVVWIAGRFDVLAVCFALAALVLYLRSQTLLALAAMTLGILSKESGYAVPALIALLPPPRGDSGWRNRARLCAPFFAVAAALLAYRWVLFGNVGGYLDASGNPQIFELNPLAIVRTLAFRIWAILFFPINWSWQPQLWLGLAMLAYLGALAWSLGWRLDLSRPAGLALPLGFVALASLPALQQMLIGADLEKSRHLYLPLVGFALLMAVITRNSRARPAVFAAVLAFQIAALWHNIGIWNYAASKTRPACMAAAACARESGHALVIGLPRTLNGVYFFANGFPTCVERELGAAPAQIEVRPTEPRPEEAVGSSCVLSWDAKSDALKPR